MLKKIGNRMKSYEEEYLTKQFLSNEKPWVARLDGHCFHSFAKVFQKPFDKHLNQFMIDTTKDLVSEFKSSCGYTQSDEITLVFPAIPKGDDPKDGFKEVFCKGRILKISTLLSGYCSARFNFHCQVFKEKYPKDYEKYDRVIDKLTSGYAYFDCRIFNLPDNNEILNNIIWRMGDSIRNSKTNLGRKYFSQKIMNGLKATVVVTKLKNEKNVDWNTYPNEYRFGTFCKKEIYEKEGINMKSGENVIVKRSRIIARSFEFPKFDEKYVDFLVSKYYYDIV